MGSFDLDQQSASRGADRACDASYEVSRGVQRLEAAVSRFPVASFLTSAAPLIWIKSLAFEGQTVPVDAQPPTPGIFIHPYLRPPLSPLSVASFL